MEGVAKALEEQQPRAIPIKRAEHLWAINTLQYAKSLCHPPATAAPATTTPAVPPAVDAEADKREHRLVRVAHALWDDYVAKHAIRYSFVRPNTAYVDPTDHARAQLEENRERLRVVSAKVVAARRCVRERVAAGARSWRLTHMDALSALDGQVRSRSQALVRDLADHAHTGAQLPVGDTDLNSRLAADVAARKAEAILLSRLPL
eukprot:TRINITY_DN2293_c0_g1_i2.p1 TRINITY_DN2293_c0_g1~~TRINITY_DN2293_c0_g1_i2.p1  ORF type:complete len:205 (+),score=36.93 TRINITY_DN2293_c0_g1_i2:50-664(+)